MTDVLRFSKKAFTWSVVGLTILWSMGVSALTPVVANAAACVLEPGDLFKVAGTSAVYYINASGKRVPFFHANHFKTLYQDYSGVETCDASATAQYPLSDVSPTTINLRSGELWKLTSEPAVYMVMNRAAGDTDVRSPVCQLTSEEQAKSWGFNLKADVLDLPDYLNGNYRKTGMCTQPNGLLVSNPGSNDVYLVSEGMLWKVDGSLPQFLAKEVHVVATGLPVGTGSVTPAAVVEKSLPLSGGTTPTTPPSAAGALSVSLAADTPAASSIVTDSDDGAQAMIPVLKVNLMGSSSGSVTVTSLKFKRGGISADTDVGNAHLYLGDAWVASNPSIASGVLTFSNASGLFTVAAGASQALTLKMDLKNSGTGSKSLNFQLSDVGVLAGSVSGLPLAAGQTFTSVAVTDLGKLAYTTISPSADSTIDPGLTSYEIWRFQAVSTNQDMEVRKLRFTIVGSVSVGDLKNFSLWQGSTQIGTTVPEMSSDKTITFDLSAAPYLVSKGQTKIFSLKTDVTGGTNRSFRATLQNDRDIITFDKQYNVYVKANGLDSFAIVQPVVSGTDLADYTVNTGTLTQTSSSGNPTGNIADGATNVTIAEFDWKANGEDIKVSSLVASSTGSDTTDILANMRLLVDGSQVGTTDSSVTANGGASAAGQADFGTFGNSFIIKAGTIVKVKIVADLTDSSVLSGATFLVGVGAGSSNAQGTVSLTSISSVKQTASTLTVANGAVTVAKNATFGNRSSTNPTGPVNASQVLVAAFTITAGSGEPIEISQITLRDDTTSDCIGTYMQNLTLKNAAGGQLGATYANPSSTCTTQNSYTFNISPAVTIAAGTQYDVNVYADLKSSLTSATSLFDVDSVNASGKNTGTSASATAGQNLSLQQSYISSVGTLTVALDSDTPLASNLLMGSVDQSLAKFKLTAGNAESLNLTEFTISASVSTTATNATGTIRNIKLVDENGVQIGTTISSLNVASTSTFNNAVFRNLSLIIPKGTSKVVTVKTDITPYESGGFSVTGLGVQLAVLMGDNSTATGNQYSYVGTGALSGTALTPTEVTFTSSTPSFALSNAERGTNSVLTFDGTSANSNVRANEFVVYRAKLTLDWAGDTPTGAAAPNVAQTVGKFVVTNASNVGGYDATLKAVNFSIASTISNTSADRAMNIYKDALSTTALATTSWLTANNQNFGNTGITDAGFTDVSIASGSTRTFYVTLDTTSAASTKNLSLTVPSSHTSNSVTFYGVTWSDGVTTNIVAHDNKFPLTYKTFTY